MSKRAARASAMSGKWTVGMLRAAIMAARGARQMSVVNPAIPHARALDIYEAAIGEMAEAHAPDPTILDVYSGRHKPSRMCLIMTNILRDCGNPTIPSAEEGQGNG